MDVEAAQARGVEHRLRQDEAIGRDHRQIRPDRREIGAVGLVAERARGADRQAERLGRRLDRARPRLLAPPGRPGRLAVDAGDLVAGRSQRPQGGHREIRRSHDDQPHRARPPGPSAQPRARSLFSFFIRAVIIARFTGLR